MFVFFFYLLFASYVSCIQNGTDVTSSLYYPFYVMIGSPHLCGGVLLSYDPAFVLTAAHCMIDGQRDLSNFIGYYDIHKSKQKKVGISGWTIHPQYNFTGYINPIYDAAVVRLDQPLAPSQRVKRAPLMPTNEHDLWTKGELVGFGYLDNQEQKAETLQKIDLDISKLNSLSNIEATAKSQKEMACHGDSGGPLVIYKNQEPYIIGTLVRIFGAKDSEKPTCPVPIYDTSVVTESFVNMAIILDWISEVTNISTQNLTDPEFTPISSVYEEPNEAHVWHIGGVVGKYGLLSNTAGWIGAVVPDYNLLNSSVQTEPFCLYCIFIVFLCIYHRL